MSTSEPSADPDREAMLADMEALIAAMRERKPAEGVGSVVDTASDPQPGSDPFAAAPWDAVARSSSGSDGDAVTPTARKLKAGSVVDRYVVLSKLGAGGMGVVYAAYDPELDRKVALKLLLHGIGGDKGRVRLLREAQALGKLADPHVVAIHDVGTLDGQVWLAMEFVRGQTLSEWLQTPRSWRETLGVMTSAGEGLAAAHAAGLLHRDFKPDNVMVGEDGRVRVMDFGLARARAEGQSSEDVPSEDDQASLVPHLETLAMPLTQAGTIVGTPSYMPPEQFGGEGLTAAADQFSFCVTLWEALYGERPFGGRNPREVVAHVLAGRRRPPPRERTVPSRLLRACERGLSVDPRARWPSMHALLDELRAVAAPRRAWMAVGVTVGLVAVGAGLGAERYAAWASRCAGAREHLDGLWDEERKQEVREAILATGLSYAPSTWEGVEQRLDAYTDAWAAKHHDVCEATRVREEQSEEDMGLRMGCLLDRKTELRAAVSVLAKADGSVAENAVELVSGLRGFSRCDDLEALRAEVPPPEDPQEAQEVEALRERLADLGALQAAGIYEQPLADVAWVVEQAEALGYDPLSAEAKLRRASLRHRTGLYAEAEQDLMEAHELAVAHRHDEVALQAARLLTYVVGYRQARFAEGRVWGRAAMALARRSGQDVDLADVLTSLGGIFMHQGDYEQALLHHERALRLREEALGSNHLSVAVSLTNVGQVLGSQGKYEQAELHHERSLRIKEAVLGADHPDVAMSLNNLGTVLQFRGRYEQAQLHYERALRIREATLGADHHLVATSLNNLGVVLEAQGKYEQAKLQHERALRIREKTLGATHPDVAQSLSNLGNVFSAQGEYEQAELHQERALRAREQALGASHPDVAESLINLGSVLAAQGKYEQAEPHWQRSLGIVEQALGADHPYVATVLNNLGGVYRAREDYEQAKLYDERALRIQEKALGADHPELAYPLDGLARAALAQEDFAAARAYAERAVAVREAGKVGPDLLAEARFLLARASWSDPTQHARAVMLAEQARDAWAEHGKGRDERLAEVEAWLRRVGSGDGDVEAR